MSDQTGRKSSFSIAQCQSALASLDVFRGSKELTEDEQKALQIVYEAFQAIERDQDLSPTAKGEAMKMRLVRRISVSFVHPLAPRPIGP